MSTVIMNDERMEAEQGELLLTVARRNGAHIGFFCDGRGFCSTCRSRILSGSEQLSQPTDAERQLMTQRQFDEGYRLACQATIEKGGSVETITRVEELRRSASEGIGNLLNNLATQAAYQVSLFPAIIPIGLSRVLNKPPKLQEITNYGGDVVRVLQRTASGRALEDQQTRQSQ